MITLITRTRYLRVAGLAVGAVLIAGLAVVVTASAAGMTFGFRPSTSAPSDAQVAAVEASASSTACSDFMKHFAVAISKSQAEISAAYQKAIADTLADEVKGGQLTQAQADTIKKKLAGQTPCALPSSAGHSAAGNAKPAIGAYMQQYITAAAAALGVTEAQLKADLAAHQSLSQVAAAQHVSEADFRTKLIANLKPALDQAVASNKLTSAQEQAIMSRLQTGPLPLWNAPARPAKPTPTATPATT